MNLDRQPPPRADCLAAGDGRPSADLLAQKGCSALNSSLPDGWLARDITSVGYSDLDHQPGFKMSIKQADGRWYLYLAHFWDSGLTVLDVTDPSDSAVLAFVPGPKNTQTLQVDLHGSLMVTSEEEYLPIFGGDASRPHGEGAVFWSLEDPCCRESSDVSTPAADTRTSRRTWQDTQETST